MLINWDDVYPQLDDAALDERRAALVRRARAVLKFGWEDFRYVWNPTDVVRVALLLEDDAILADLGTTRTAVLSSAAYDLFGFSAGRQDNAEGNPRVLQWFLSAHSDLIPPGRPADS
ncbi:hypothetical protein [Nocardia salmonicida]|uniref:hypothetical protein n=1 Tax=Nocardia salmonicida TaxID=53431 RepID=UPI003CF21FCC